MPNASQVNPGIQTQQTSLRNATRLAMQPRIIPIMTTTHKKAMSLAGQDGSQFAATTANNADTTGAISNAVREWTT
jgi:hypothetical protein